MALTEKVELLGKGLYGDKIPDILTIKAIPTASELEYVSAEDFDKTMIEKILPICVEEKINFYELLEIDYHWLLRCLRILNYGPYVSTNFIVCPNCGQVQGDFRCNLNAVECIPVPPGFTGTVKISRDEFLDFNGDVYVKLLTIREALNADTDTSFVTDGRQNTSLARRCYMIQKLGTTEHVPPLEMKLALEKQLSAADYVLLGDLIREKADFGLRASGLCTCEQCGSKEARFITFINERFFRPTVDDLRAWKADRVSGGDADTSGSKTEGVREHDGRDNIHSEGD